MQRANRDAANAALKIAREELAQMSLIAPFSGIAAGVHIRNHQVVAAGQPVITLTRTDLLDVVFSIPENLFTSPRYPQYRLPSRRQDQYPAGPRVYRGIQRAYRQQRQ